jgi:hypothetical protein
MVIVICLHHSVFGGGGERSVLFIPFHNITLVIFCTYLHTSKYGKINCRSQQVDGTLKAVVQVAVSLVVLGA